jgi:hypothetical protein
MGLSEVVANLFTSLSIGIAVLLAALVAQRVAARWQHERKERSEEIEKIAGVVRADENARAATLAKKHLVELKTVEENGEYHPWTRSPPLTEKSPAAAAIERLVSNYHEQALSQASTQFWFSIMAATAGFIWILYAGSAMADKFATATKLLPGTVIDAVAILFLKQSSQTRQRATELYDRLRHDKEIADSASLLLSIENVQLRSAVGAQIALHMAGLVPTPIDLSKLLIESKNATDATTPIS